jgi:hypothetical protein
MSAIDSRLLEMKQSIEERLMADMAQGAAVQSLDALQATGNIQGVAIGLNEGGGGEPGVPALTVYVAESASAGEVRSVLAQSFGIQAAADLDAPLNVEVTGLIDAQAHRFRIRRAPGGVSVGHVRVTAGTVGCFAVGRNPPRTNRLLLLSNNHVIANSNNAAYGDSIIQPGSYDGGRHPQDQLAILERFVPINFTGGVNYVDAATGWCWPDRVRRELMYLNGATPVFFRIGSAPVAPTLGRLVGKTGRTTQLKQGRIIQIGATIRVNYGAGRVALFRDQIAIRGTSAEFSAGGDSGSSVWTWDSVRSPVGLLFAGGGGITFANVMTRVVAALDIRLYT